VVIWNAAELSAERVIRDGLTDRITAVRFTPTPDGGQLAIADGRIAEEGTIRIADPGSGAIVASWKAHDDTIYDMAVSPDGKLLATAGGDKLAKIWDISSHTETARIEAHATQILAIAFNPGATQLITGGADHQLKAWDLKTRDLTTVLGSHAVGINAVAWAATGPALFAAEEAGGLLRYTDFKPHTGAQSSESATERRFEAAGATLYSISVSAAADRVFAGAHDGRIFGWNKDGKLIITRQVNAPTLTAAAK
jgi:WD40 repeat protein